MQKEGGIKNGGGEEKWQMRENEMRGKKESGGGRSRRGEGAFCQHFLSKERRKVGRISGRDSAGVAPPDLDWATESSPPFQLVLFMLCSLS